MAKNVRKRAPILDIARQGEVNIYISCSWQNDKGQDASWLLVDALDKLRVACVGGVKVSGDQDPVRIRRILGQCSGVAVIIPYRGHSELPTSQFIWQELELAAGEGIPVLLLYDAGVPLHVTETDAGKQLAIPSCALPPVTVATHLFYGPITFGVSGVDDAATLLLNRNVVTLFAEQTKLTSSKTGEPYAFLSTRLKQDFGLARDAVLHALESAIGITCLWADSNRYSTSIKSVQERTAALIADSQFVVADLTFGPESPDYDSPSRAHEVGMAEAMDKEILLTAQAPRRSPYFAASHLQMEFWKDEQELYNIVHTWADNRKARYGRRRYNRELALNVPTHKPTVVESPFMYRVQERYIAPNAYALTVFESTVVAIGFAFIALSVSFLAHELFEFDDTFDFASIIAALATLVFASDLNGLIRTYLGRWPPLRWLIPAAGLTLLAVWAAIRYSTPG